MKKNKLSRGRTHNRPHVVEGPIPINPIVLEPLGPIVEDDDSLEGEIAWLTSLRNDPIILKPALRAVILDNDETTGSYGIVFSLLSHLRKLPHLTDDDVAGIYQRLAYAMDYYNIFRPYLKDFFITLDALQNENLLDAVVMYTNQTDESFVLTNALEEADRFPLKTLLYSVPLSIAYLMNESYHSIVFDKLLSRPPLLRGIQHASCPKSFSRIFECYPDHCRSTEKILFVDDNACPEFITACPKTEIHPHSYVRPPPYVRILSEHELDTFLAICLHGMSVPPATVQAIREQYRHHSPVERISENSQGDDVLETLRKYLVEFYAI
jgi:hypothetical protein